MGSDSIALAPGVPFPPSLHFLTVHLMGRLRPHEPESRMFGDSPFGPIGKTNPAKTSSASINEKTCDPQPNGCKPLSGWPIRPCAPALNLNVAVGFTHVRSAGSAT